MTLNKQSRQHFKEKSTQKSAEPETQKLEATDQFVAQPNFIQRARLNPKSLSPSEVLQLQRLIGNQAVGKLLHPKSSSAHGQTGLAGQQGRVVQLNDVSATTIASPVQRLNGATPNAFGVANSAVDPHQCKISTTMQWGSSNGNRADLSDIQQREQVTFNADPRVNVPGYAALLAQDPAFQLAGNTVLTKGIGPMSGPGGTDTHSGAAYGTKFTINGVPNLQKGNWVLTGTQYYQYQVGGAGPWVNLHAPAYTIIRTMAQVGDHYELTLQKNGGPEGLALTAGPTRIKFESNQAVGAVGAARVDQTADWQAALNSFNNLGLTLQPLAVDNRQATTPTGAATNIGITYNYTDPTNLPPAQLPFLASYQIQPAWRNLILSAAREAVNPIVQKALKMANPPTRFIITIFRANGVQQQAFWTNEGGAPGSYRVILRAEKLMDMAQWGGDLNTSMAGRESKRAFKDNSKRKAFAKAVVTHEIGHMLHAFTSPNMYLTATMMPAMIPLIPALDPLRPEKAHIATVNGQVMTAVANANYKQKWGYAGGNPGEVVPEVFTAYMHGRNVPRGLAAIYIAYGGIRSPKIDAKLRKSLGVAALPVLAQPEDAIPYI